MKILKQNSDGTVLAFDPEKDKLVKGKPVLVGHDQFVSDITVSEDGKTIDKAVKYKDYVHGHGRLTRDAFVRDRTDYYVRDQKLAKDLALASAKADWEAEKKPVLAKKTVTSVTVPLTLAKKADEEIAKLYSEIFAEHGEVIAVRRGDEKTTVEIEKKIKLYEWSDK